ncbi:MAG: hypothetical protein ACLR13_07730 [Acutalibacteraceae bacterium]
MYGKKHLWYCTQCRNGFAAVQLQGYYSELPYTGSGMKVGILKLGATSDKAEVSETGKECLVVDMTVNLLPAVLFFNWKGRIKWLFMII